MALFLLLVIAAITLAASQAETAAIASSEVAEQTPPLLGVD
jgi:hypothetical protein